MLDVRDDPELDNISTKFHSLYVSIVSKNLIKSSTDLT